MEELKTGTWFTGIGSPEQALRDLKVPHRNVMAADWDKYARKTYLANFKPEQMFEDVTKIDCASIEPLDLFIAGFPCQAFSLAGKRLGFEETRGTLFFNTADFIRINRPKMFILENVKGLLSHDKPKGSKSKTGRTFNTIIGLLAHTVNYQENMFPYDDNLGYNVHYAVLNSKNFGVPQNRERVFIVGIRPDLPNDFRFPLGFPLVKRLRDVLEKNVAEKYYLSDKILEGFKRHDERHKAKGTGFLFKPKTEDDVATCLRASGALGATDNAVIINEPFCVAMRGRDPENPSARVTGQKNEQRLEPNSQGTTNTLTSVSKDNLIFEPPTDKIIIAGNLDQSHEASGRIYDTDGIAPTVTAKQGGNHEPKILISGNLDQVHEASSRVYDPDGIAPTVKQNMGAIEDDVICHNMQPSSADRPSLKYSSGGSGHLQREDGLTYCLDTGATNAVEVKGTGRIRRLTELECFRLQGFPDDFHKPNSCSQLIKQAGNSITVDVIRAVIKSLLKL